jgi:uncharacterized protein (TIGR02996 family)
MTHAPLTDDDRAFIRAILADPSDDAPRLVYADWLDERGDMRGRFLRLEVELAGLLNPPAGAQALVELRGLAGEIDPKWIALIDRPRIENCDTERPHFRFQCPKTWEQLEPTDNEAVRFCETCQQKVYFCSSVQEAAEHARRGGCVAITTLAVRREGDLEDEKVVESLEIGLIGFDDTARFAPAEEERQYHQEERRRPWWRIW